MCDKMITYPIACEARDSTDVYRCFKHWMQQNASDIPTNPCNLSDLHDRRHKKRLPVVQAKPHAVTGATAYDDRTRGIRP